MSVILTFFTMMALVLVLSLSACGSNNTNTLEEYCNPNGGAGIGTAACNGYQAKQVGITEAFGILEPEGDSQDDAQDDLQDSLPPLTPPLAP